jgi:uncharacterized protein YhbP (UPF0306 family)
MNTRALFAYLKSQRLMSLATFGKQLSACTVYYAMDRQFHLYVISEPESEHVRNIAMNDQVACTIADSRQHVNAKKIGVQIKGTAHVVSNRERLKAILAMWNRTNPGIASVINLKNIKAKVIDSVVLKISPLEISFFNEALFGPEGVEQFHFKKKI